MTFGSLWGSGTTPNAASNDYSAHLPSSIYYAGERGDSGGYGYPSGGATKSKKAEKKQAAMSALTLIAFLFFLNILQNCLKEQMEEAPTAAIMMLAPNQIHSRNPDQVDDVTFHRQETKVEETDHILQKRKLLSVKDNDDDEGIFVNQDRQRKFIHDFGMESKDWTNELSQVTDDDLNSQKKKLDKLRTLWNNRNDDEAPPQLTPTRKIKPNLAEELMQIKVKKFINNPILSDLKGIPRLSQRWVAQKASTVQSEPKYVEFEEPTKKVADFHEFESLVETETPNVRNSIAQSATVNTHYNTLYQHQESSSVIPTLRVPAPVGKIEAVSDPFGTFDTSSTPRYRRSDEQLTTLPSESLFHPEVNYVTPNPVMHTISTEKTYHVYTHPSQVSTDLWRTTTVPSSTVTTTTTTVPTTTEKPNINEIYLTTMKPVNGKNYYSKHYFGYPANHKPNYRPATRYPLSPYRRVSYEPPLVRQEYYPMSVVGQYGGHGESPIVGVFQLIWTLVSSFARPIARLIPQVAKVDSDAQCFDLLACEAHRVGSYMGPTAQAVATTFSSLLTWLTPETDKYTLEAAVAAARENTCAEQIKACDDRSGGKSTITMVAKIMETKSDRGVQVPRG